MLALIVHRLVGVQKEGVIMDEIAQVLRMGHPALAEWLGHTFVHVNAPKSSS
jgi:hypothetical protein